jgi:hypothetical protein
LKTKSGIKVEKEGTLIKVRASGKINVGAT